MPGAALSRDHPGELTIRLLAPLVHEYRATRKEDLDGDGTVSPDETIDEAIYDLKWVSKTTSGVIWTKAHPIPKKNSEQPLELILDNYADSMSGAGLYAQGNLFGVEQAMVRNFMAFLTSRNSGQMGSAPSLFGAIEIGETERLRQDARHRSGKVKIGLVKFHYFVPLEADNTQASSGAPKPTASLCDPQAETNGRTSPTKAGSARSGPGCSSRATTTRPSTSMPGLPDFDALTARITFPDAEALPVPALTPSEPAPPAPTPTEAAPTPAQPPSTAPAGEGQPVPNPPATNAAPASEAAH